MADSLSADERLRRIELRMESLEKALNLLLVETGRVDAPVQKPPTPSIPLAPTQRTKPQHPHKPEIASGNLLGVIGIICFILAGAFIVKLAIESGWLTPERQEGLAALFGFSLIGAGFWLLKEDRAYASLLPGAGIVVLYLTALAAHVWHGLFSFQVSLGLIVLISQLSIWIYTKIKHDIYPLAAAVGAYLAPLLLGIESQADFTLYYYVVCSIAFSYIAIWLETRTLAIVASYLAIGATMWLGTTIKNYPVLVVAMPLHFFIYALGALLQTIDLKKPLSQREAWSFFPVLLLFYAGEYNFIHILAPSLAPWVSLSFAGFLIAVYFASKRILKDAALHSGDLIAAFAAVVLFHAVYLELLRDAIRPWLFPAIIIGLTFRRFSVERASGKNVIPALAVGVILLSEFLRIAFHVLTGGSDNSWILLALLSTAALFSFYLNPRNEAEGRGTFGAAVLGAAHVLALLGLYRLMDENGSLAVSGAWLAYAVMVMTLGFWQKDSVLAKSALLALTLAAAKALLYDAASAPTVVRIVCLLLTGAVLYACGFALRKISSWTT